MNKNLFFKRMAILVFFLSSATMAYGWDPIYVFGGNALVIPGSLPVGTVISRYSISTESVCGKQYCTIHKIDEFIKGGKGTDTTQGPLVETTVPGISVRLLGDGVPMEGREYNGSISVRQFEVQLVKTSDASSGGVSGQPNGSPQYFNIISRDNNSTSDISVGVNINSNITVIPGACSVDSSIVRLNDVRVFDFPLIESEVGERPFVVSIHNCPSGLNKIDYAINPLDGVVPGMMGVLNLSGNSTARGIGIRLRGEDKSIIDLNSRHEAIGYSNSERQFTIPFFASYIKIGNKVSPGSVEGKIIISLIYH